MIFLDNIRKFIPKYPERTEHNTNMLSTINAKILFVYKGYYILDEIKLLTKKKNMTFLLAMISFHYRL